MDFLEFTVINFENKYAILQNQIFGKINWPIKKLPEEVEIGSTVFLSASLESPTQDSSQNLNIKKLLEEIIN